MKSLPEMDLKKRYLLSFVLASIVPLLIIILWLYVPLENLLRNESLQTDAIKVKQLRDTVDMRVTELYNLALQVSNDERIREFLYKKAPLDSNSNYELNKAFTILSGYKAGNSFISMIAVYFPGLSSVITHEGKYNDDYFFENILKYEDADPVITKQTMAAVHYNEFIPMKSITGTYVLNGRYITYVHSLPVGDKKAMANIIMLIDERSMFSVVGDTKDENREQIMAIDRNGGTIFSKGYENNVEQIVLSRMQSGMESFTVDLPEQGQVIATCAASNTAGWGYAVLTGMSGIVAKINGVRKLAFLIGLISLITAILLSIVMTTYSYKPWNNLVRYIRMSYGKASISKNYDNGYQYARNVFATMLMEREQMQSDMGKNRSYLKDYVLQRICSGRSISSEDMEKAGLRFPHRFFYAIIIDIDSQMEHSLHIPVFAAKLVNIFFKDTTACSFEDEKGRTCLIVNTDYEDEDAVIRQIRIMKERLSLHTGYLLYAGVGNSCTGINGLANSCREAKKSIEYSTLRGDASAVYYPEIQKYIFTSLNLPVHSDNPLMNCVKAGDYKACSRLLDDYFKSISGDGSTPVQYMYCLFYNFVGVVIKVCEEIHADFRQVFGQSPEQLLDIDKYRNSRQMIENVYDIYSTLCNFVQNNKSNQSYGLKLHIEKIINERFTNPDFSLAELADEIGYSSSYLSHFIKQQFGIGFNELFNRARLEFAKKLLLSGMTQIGEVADRSGYTSTNSFIRSFKRMEGITPGQYRDLQIRS